MTRHEFRSNLFLRAKHAIISLYVDHMCERTVLIECGVMKRSIVWWNNENVILMFSFILSPVYYGKMSYNNNSRLHLEKDITSLRVSKCVNFFIHKIFIFDFMKIHCMNQNHIWGPKKAFRKIYFSLTG